MGRPVLHRRMPIADMDTPTPEEMSQTLALIDQALADGRSIYVHCWGGIGRTGTVVGCHLVQHGLSGIQAIEEIARLRAGTPDAWRASPETEEQRQMVLSWESRRSPGSSPEPALF
jgi:protein-tyrosine phosphatase